MPAKIDWDAVRIGYVANEHATFAGLARAFGVSRRSMMARARKEDWESDREKFRAEVQRAVREQSAQQLAEMAKSQLVEMLADVASARRRMMETISRDEAVEIEETETVMEADECGAPVKRTRKLARLGRDVRNIGAVLSAERGLLRDILGLDSGGVEGPGYDPDDSFV
ncbi:MAG: hypothetical protein RL885_25005 [Planctomycetota bacterium]